MAMSENIVDRWVVPEIRVLGRPVCAFRACGYVGLTSAFLIAAGLVIWQGLSLLVLTGITLSACLTFLMLAAATKVVTGEEQLIYYHHEVAIISVSAFLLRLLHEPVLPYLDVTILGLGMFLACGRVGCLMVGCCHGRPSEWGIRYRAEHAAAGFPRYLVGVQLFPIQAVESVAVFCTVIVGSVFVLKGDPPGTALAWYVAAYDSARFCFEFARGDTDRHYFWGFSEAQWTSVLLMAGVLWAEVIGLLPFQARHCGIGAILIVIMLGVTVYRRFASTSKYRLLHPRHVEEVANTLQVLSEESTLSGSARSHQATAAPVRVVRTSLGIQMSSGRIRIDREWINQYCLSRETGTLTEDSAKVLTRLVLQLKHLCGARELIKGQWNVFHLLVRDSDSASQRADDLAHDRNPATIRQRSSGSI
jgi:prolipoprotein diacylglyceryltransferase